MACPTPLLPLGAVPTWVNALSWRGQRLVFNQLFLGPINDERAMRGLAPVLDLWSHMVGGHLIYAGESALAPLPEDVPPGIFTSGAWTLDDTTPLDPGIEAFLRDGPPPVYVGFGSMPDARPDRTSRLIADAVAQAGVRALISSGWARLGAGALPATLRLIGATSHARLFPRLAAVVHHGGAGTTTAAARAGIPQIVVPHGFDQLDWGRRVHERGLSPPPIAKTRLSAVALAEALRAATRDSAMRDRAARFAGTLTRDGVARAIEHITAVVEQHRARRLRRGA